MHFLFHNFENDFVKLHINFCADRRLYSNSSYITLSSVSNTPYLGLKFDLYAMEFWQ